MTTGEMKPSMLYFNELVPLGLDSRPRPLHRLHHAAAAERIRATGLELVRMADPSLDVTVAGRLGSLLEGRVLERPTAYTQLFRRPSWRFSALVQDQCPSPRPFVFVDYHLPEEDRRELTRWQWRRTDADVAILKVNPTIGFTDYHVGLIEDFARTHPPQLVTPPEMTEQEWLRSEVIS